MPIYYFFNRTYDEYTKYYLYIDCVHWWLGDYIGAGYILAGGFYSERKRFGVIERYLIINDEYYDEILSIITKNKLKNDMFDTILCERQSVAR